MLPSATSTQFLLARLGDARIGFAASAVHEIARAVAITPLAGAPDIIEGVINVHGRIVPVVDVRRRLSMHAVALAPEQFLIVIEVADRLIAVRVDDVEDLLDVAADSLTPPASLSPVLRRLEGISALSDGALVIYDADAFLTQAEREALDAAETVGA